MHTLHGIRLSEVNMTVDEELRILSYYMKPGLHSDLFSEDTIQTLKDAGYLGCGITLNLEETLKTTQMGRMYMSSYGVPIPDNGSEDIQRGVSR